MLFRFRPIFSLRDIRRTACRWSMTWLVVTLVGPAFAQDAELPLSPGDEVQITVFGEPDFSGKYTINTAGNLMVPWAGRMPVKGMSLTQLEQGLTDRLKADYLADPKVNASIATYRPFYVMGDVKSPGKYPYADATVMLQAIAAAGGFRSAEPADVRLAQDYVRAQEDADLVLVDLRAALALEARLLTERDGRSSVDMPDELRSLGEPEARAAIEAESQLFDNRRQALNGEISLLQMQKAGYQEELTALNGQIEAKNRQAKLLQEELGDVTTLVKQGIERKPQMLLLQRTVAEADVDRLQIESYLARAKQNIAGADLSLANKRNDRTAEVLRLLQETGSRLQRLRTQRVAALKIVDNTETLLARQGSSTDSLPEGRPGRHVLRVTRLIPDGVKVFVANDDTPVMPGDLIDVLPTRKTTPQSGPLQQSSEVTPADAAEVH